MWCLKIECHILGGMAKCVALYGPSTYVGLCGGPIVVTMEGHFRVGIDVSNYSYRVM